MTATMIPVLYRRYEKVPRSLDRFADYSKADMEWAVPLGLAEWVNSVETIVCWAVHDRNTFQVTKWNIEV